MKVEYERERTKNRHDRIFAANQFQTLPVRDYLEFRYSHRVTRGLARRAFLLIFISKHIKVIREILIVACVM